MAWQAEAWMYFRMPAGHLSTTPEDFRRWPITNTLQTWLPVPDAAAQFREFLAAYKVDAIVIADGARRAERELVQALGVRPLRVGGVALYSFPQKVAAR